MNAPQCKNCRTEIESDERICLSCGCPQWYECDYCGLTASTLGTIAQHMTYCEEKEPERGLFDY